MANNGDIYVANNNISNITKYDSSGAEILIPGSFPITDGIINPYGIFVDSGGFIYVSNFAGQNITKYNSSGIQITTGGFPITDGINYPQGISVDSNGFIYVANFVGQNITKYNSSGIQITTGGFPITDGINKPPGISVDSNGFIYVTNLYGNSITKYNSSGIQITTGGFPISINAPSGIFVDSGGFIYVTTTINITKYDSSGDEILIPGSFPITDGINAPNGIFVDSNGFIYVTNYDDSSITKYDSSGTQITTGGFPIFYFDSGPSGIFVVNNNPICYSRGTKILCDSGYLPIEDLKPGDLVQTYLHGNLPIEVIGKGQMINDPTNWKKCMYYKKSTENFEDLIVTGGHSILIDSIPKNAEKNEVSKEYYSQPDSMIDDKYLIFAGFCNNFNQITEILPFEYYHFNLKSNSDIDRRYGVWANGVLSESSFKKDVRSNLELIQ